MREKLAPFHYTLPGDILLGELKQRNLSQRDLAQIIGRPPKTINEIIKGKKAITPETALQLEQALETPAEFWLELEADYQFQKSRTELANLRAADPDIEMRRLIHQFPVREMAKLGWINLSKDLKENASALCELLGVESLDAPLELKASFRQTPTKTPNTDHQYAWVQRVHYLADQQAVGTYNEEEFEAALPALLDRSSSLSFLQEIPGILNNLGVHFLIVPHLTKTYLDGAALYHKDNPVIVLTLRYNRIDSFWFNLLHEAGHILKGHVTPGKPCLDSLEHRTKHRVSSSLDIEKEADNFAYSHLIPVRKYNSFVRQQNGSFTKKAIEEFAKEINRHPGIVLGRLQFEDKVAYSRHRSLLVKVKDHFKGIFDIP